uniref:Uncharacterized protein n=1 Tax=Meloidogyne enterolobii TaxID=390850 RepID=A0A6V7VXV9_MELEN|nr:unnamed protein product [Meloidogyne enterolobii]
MEGSSSSNKPTKTRFAKIPSFKFSRQQSNLSSASSNNPIDEMLGKAAKKFKNLLNKSKEKVKEVGRDVSEVVHRGEHKYKYDKISENLQKYADSEGILNSEYRILVKTKFEIMNKYGKDLKTVKDSAHDFYEFVRSIEMIVAKPKNFRNKIIGQIKAHFLKDNEKVEEKYIGVIKQMMNDYNSYDDEKDKKVINLLAQTLFILVLVKRDFSVSVFSVKYRYRKNTDFFKIVRYRIRYRYFGKNTAVLPKNTAVIRYRDQH